MRIYEVWTVWTVMGGVWAVVEHDALGAWLRTYTTTRCGRCGQQVWDEWVSVKH